MTIRIWKTRACVTLAACAAAEKDNEDKNADAIVNGVHGYMPENQVEPKQPAVREKLEWFKNQILDLVRDYGLLDVIWLDGGQVQRKTGLDIGIEEIIAAARGIKPDLISADRTAGGTCENVITPEQTVPPKPIAVPWESCITMGTGFSYRYDDVYKSPRELVHLLMDIVAKGGNLALNVAPAPDGRLPQPAVDRMEALARAWRAKNGEGVYATRPVAPFASGHWRFTSKDRAVYATRPRMAFAFFFQKSFLRIPVPISFESTSSNFADQTGTIPMSFSHPFTYTVNVYGLPASGMRHTGGTAEGSGVARNQEPVTYPSTVSETGMRPIAVHPHGAMDFAARRWYSFADFYCLIS